MPKIAVIGGSGLKQFKKKGIMFLQRHGKYTPPHRINHKRNILSLKKKGVKTIIGINSVGSLKKSIKPGCIVIPHDYINLRNIQTYYDIKAKHVTPCLSGYLRKRIINAAKKAKIKTINKGVYIQTIGPRLETKAEIGFIKDFADIVGMTMANEATLANELNIRYASICSVDNYAHGISKEKLSFKKIKENQKKNRKNIARLLSEIIK